MLTAKLAALYPLSFVAVQQAIYVNKLNSDLQVGVVCVIVLKIIPSYYKIRYGISIA